MSCSTETDAYMRSCSALEKEECWPQCSGSAPPTVTHKYIWTKCGGNPCKGKNAFCIKYRVVLSASKASSSFWWTTCDGSLVWFVPCVSGLIAAAVNKLRKTLAHNIFVAKVDDRGRPGQKNKYFEVNIYSHTWFASHTLVVFVLVLFVVFVCGYWCVLA